MNNRAFGINYHIDLGLTIVSQTKEKYLRTYMVFQRELTNRTPYLYHYCFCPYCQSINMMPSQPLTAMAMHISVDTAVLSGVKWWKEVEWSIVAHSVWVSVYRVLEKISTKSIHPIYNIEVLSRLRNLVTVRRWSAVWLMLRYQQMSLCWHCFASFGKLG